MAIVRRFSVGKLPEDKVFKGQPKVIMDHLAKHPKSTVAEMAKAIGNFEGSRQTPERVIGFYMTTFKKQGLVRVEEEVVKEDTKGDAAEADSGEEEEDDEELDEEALPGPQRVEYHEELAADAPEEHGGKFDGLKMTEAVRQVLKLKRQAGPLKPDQVAEYLTENGYVANKNQVNGALVNLIKQGVAKKDESNGYSLR